MPEDPGCTSNNCPMKNSRKSRINFKCSTDKSPVPEPYVYERNVDGYPSHCEYEFTVASMWACPTECNISSACRLWA